MYQIVYISRRIIHVCMQDALTLGFAQAPPYFPVVHIYLNLIFSMNRIVRMGMLMIWSDNWKFNQPLLRLLRYK